MEILYGEANPLIDPDSPIRCLKQAHSPSTLPGSKKLAAPAVEAGKNGLALLGMGRNTSRRDSKATNQLSLRTKLLKPDSEIPATREETQ